MAVPRSICKKEVFYVSIGHYLEYQQGLQIRSSIRQLLWESPVLLHLICNLYTIDIYDCCQLSAACHTIPANPF